MTQEDAIEGFSSAQVQAVLETLVGSAPIGLAFLDRELRYIHINEFLAEMNGIPRLAHLGRKVSEIVPDLWPVVAPCYRQVLEDGVAVRNLEISGTTAKAAGETRYFLTNYFPIRNAAGEVQGVGLTVTETTEQKRAQRALRVNEQRYRSLIEAASQTVWTTDPRGQLLEPASRWMAFTGQSRGAHLGLGWLDAIHPADRARFVTEWRATLETRTPYRGELRLQHRDGAWRDVVVRGVPVLDDDGIVREWVATAEDVSVHRAAERELRQTTQALAASQERYRTFVAQSTEGIWRMEVDPPLDTHLPETEQVDALIARGRIAETNEVMAAMTGFDSARDMVGSTLRQLLDRTTDIQGMSVRAFIRDGYRAVDVETRQPDRDGIMRVRLANFVGIIENGQLLRIWGTQRDITEQTQAKEALEISRAQARQREQQLRIITDALPALVAYVDRDERIVFCNRASETWFGVPPQDLVGRTVREAGGEAFQSLFRDWLRRALAGEHATHETALTLKDQRQLHVQSTFVPYREGHGQVQGCVVLVNDITDRKRTEAEVEAQRARLYDVLMNAPASIAILTGPEQTFSLVNPVYRRMSGGVDLRGMSLLALARQSARARDYSEELAHVYATGHGKTATEQPLLVDHEGGAVDQRYFNIVYQPLRDARGEVDSVLSFALDVTEQVRARQKAEELAAHLRSQQSWLEAVLDLTPIPLVLVEPGSGRALFANQASHQLAGGHFPLDVPVQRYDTAYSVVDEGGQPMRNERTPGARAAQGEALRRVPGTWMTLLGRREVLVDSEQLPAMHGHPSTVVLAIQDVTQLKEIEVQLQEAVRLRDEFLTVASHELKTPLTPLQIKLQGLARAAMGSTSEGQLRQRVLHTAQNTSLQVRKLTALINDLLDVTQLTGAPLPLELGDVDLSEVVREVARQFRTPASQAGSELVIQSPGPVVGRWDGRRLEQVVRGLVSNAIKYGAGEPVVLRVEKESGMGRLTVRDRGIGIAKQDLGRIFDKFGRAVSARNYGGLGLGLFLSRRIVEAHQGTIRVESRQGQGASFIVELPLSGPELQPPQAVH
ncbi:PAS domain-containing protein [Myxococcus sp. K15C18031901]|uniref:PAS domain-containing protein n=1 Tax=Myxococcus dinghuensis TaxID=2906761 RepID=UPI0020A78950|nr:PAS domain-containing protein [Myxococcus dinghuensis]MCP3101516.1 PAS domain-containing protein [Myxococcus dinghuensis]